jgi:TPP-dependent pyruvate/acetoin dehydrogenase alpha subunit
VKTAREGGGPTLIECKTYRFHTHFEGEPDTYRSKEEVAVWKQRDPLSVYRKRLTETSVAGERALEDLEREVEEELSTAIEFARNSPLPPARSALDDVYA